MFPPVWYVAVFPFRAFSIVRDHSILLQVFAAVCFSLLWKAYTYYIHMYVA